MSRLIGFGRIGGELALDGEISEPVLDRLADVRRPHITGALWPLPPSWRSPESTLMNGARASRLLCAAESLIRRLNQKSDPWPKQRPSTRPAKAEAPRRCPSCCRSRCRRLTTISCPRACRSTPGQFVVAPLGTGGLSRRGLAAPRGRAAARDRPQEAPRDHRIGRRRAASAARLARLRRLGRELHAVLARHGVAHDDERGPRLRPARAALRRAARRAAARAHDAGPRPRARGGEQRAHLGQIEPRRGGRRESRASSTGWSMPARSSPSRCPIGTRIPLDLVARAREAHQGARQRPRARCSPIPATDSA